MRKELEKLDGDRRAFTGTFVKTGIKKGYKGKREETIMLKNIQDIEGNFICDHLWFNYTKGFEKLGFLASGDQLRFEARVKEYKKGYINKKANINESQIDYRLSHPTKIERIK